jgi:protein-disulfide isomerase
MSAISNPTLPKAGHDHIQGPIDAPFTLVEYGDYQCPYCGAAYPMVKAIQEKLGKKLCFAFRNFPLATMHPYAEHAAEAAEAAAEQGRFWEMHDILFENQNALTDEDIAQYAEELGMDAERLMGEVRSGTHALRIKEDFRGGARNGVNGTPTFFVNGVRFDGPAGVSELYAALTEGGA